MGKNKLMLSGVVLPVMVALSLAGCGSNSSTSNQSSASSSTSNQSNTTTSTSSKTPVTITFWDSNAGPSRTPYWQHLISEFEAQNPNIHVTYVGLPWTSSQQKYDTAIAANSTPDVGDVPSEFLSDFVDKGALLPLGTYLSNSPLKNNLISSIVDVNKTVAPDHKLYMIPYSNNLEGIWYRSDWFQKAGLSAPTSWNAFFKDAGTLTNPAKSQYGFSMRGGSGGVKALQTMMYAYSGITTPFDSAGKSTVNSPKNIEFVKKYVAMYGKDTAKSDLNNGYKEITANFDNGIAAMIQHNLGSANDHLKALGTGHFAFAAMPPSSNGKEVVVGGEENGLSIFKGTKHPNAAWKFVSFVLTAQNQSYWNQNVGQMPTNKLTLNDQWVQNSPWIGTALKALNSPNTTVMIPPIWLPDYSTILKQTLDPDFQKVLLGQMSVTNFMNTWANLFTQSEARYEKALKN